MQGFDVEQEGNIDTLLYISQRIETMEEWTESNKSSAGKRDRSVSEKSEKSPNKRQKTGFFCEYHGPKKSHGTKDCTAVKAILQSACKSRNKKHGSAKAASSPATTNDYQKRVSFKKPWNRQTKDEYVQTVFTTAFKTAAGKYSAKYLAKKNGGPPTEEFNNLHLEDGKVEKDASSESDSTSSDGKWSSLRGTRRKPTCLALENYNNNGPVKKKVKMTNKTTEIVASICINNKQSQTRVLRVVVDTGASASVI